MIKLTPSKTSDKITVSGKHYVSVDLNGGRATLKAKIKGARKAKAITGGELEDGIHLLYLPIGTITLEDIQGDPEVVISPI
ncbi:hypothetical protein [Marisediminitalea sp.]|uniref:hypothetical protein n=1 Tax=Marisediminitalea sp. TaxID=2662268 RepID=UPI0035168C8F